MAPSQKDFWWLPLQEQIDKKRQRTHKKARKGSEDEKRAGKEEVGLKVLEVLAPALCLFLSIVTAEWVGGGLAGVGVYESR